MIKNGLFWMFGDTSIQSFQQKILQNTDLIFLNKFGYQMIAFLISSLRKSDLWFLFFCSFGGLESGSESISGSLLC